MSRPMFPSSRSGIGLRQALLVLGVLLDEALHVGAGRDEAVASPLRVIQGMPDELLGDAAPAQLLRNVGVPEVPGPVAGLAIGDLGHLVATVSESGIESFSLFVLDIQVHPSS